MDAKLDQFVQEYKKFYHYTWRLCNDKELAKDILQDAFIKANTSAHTLTYDHTCPKAWFYTVIRSTYLNYHNKENVRQNYKITEINNQQININFSENKGYRNLQEEENLKILEAKAKNKFEFNILQLIYDGYTSKDVAEKLNEDEQVVRNRLSVIRNNGVIKSPKIKHEKCVEENCNQPVHVQIWGLCRNHYQNNYNNDRLKKIKS